MDHRAFEEFCPSRVLATSVTVRSSRTAFPSMHLPCLRLHRLRPSVHSQTNEWRNVHCKNKCLQERKDLNIISSKKSWWPFKCVAALFCIIVLTVYMWRKTRVFHDLQICSKLFLALINKNVLYRHWSSCRCTNLVFKHLILMCFLPGFWLLGNIQ